MQPDALVAARLGCRQQIDDVLALAMQKHVVAVPVWRVQVHLCAQRKDIPAHARVELDVNELHKSVLNVRTSECCRCVNACMSEPSWPHARP